MAIRDHLGIFCSMVCRNNVAHPGFCEACIAATTPMSSGDNFRFNGIGSTFLGGTDDCKICGSVVQTQWFSFFFIPIAPLGKYRVKYIAPNQYLSRRLAEKTKAHPTASAPKDWQVIADNLAKAGWTWGCSERVDSNGKTIFVADAQNGGKRFIVRADDRLTAFSELDRQIRAEFGSILSAIAGAATSATSDIPKTNSRARGKRPILITTVAGVIVVAIGAAVWAFVANSSDSHTPSNTVRAKYRNSPKSPYDSLLTSPSVPSNLQDQFDRDARESGKIMRDSLSSSAPDSWKPTNIAPYRLSSPAPVSWSPSPPSLTPPSPVARITYRVAGLAPEDPYLNIRSGPGANFAVVGVFTPSGRGILLGNGQVRNGTTVWQEVFSGTYHGWVNADYLRPENP